MITNESIFDGMRRTRRSGSRSAWAPAPWWQARPTRGFVLVTEPVETITETDVFDDSAYDQCVGCGEHDYAAMLSDGWCSFCFWQNEIDHRETAASIDRVVSARMR